jgi:hypothetical protein
LERERGGDVGGVGAGQDVLEGLGRARKYAIFIALISVHLIWPLHRSRTLRALNSFNSVSFAICEAQTAQAYGFLYYFLHLCG